MIEYKIIYKISLWGNEEMVRSYQQKNCTVEASIGFFKY